MIFVKPVQGKICISCLDNGHQYNKLIIDYSVFLVLFIAWNRLLVIQRGDLCLPLGIIQDNRLIGFRNEPADACNTHMI